MKLVRITGNASAGWTFEPAPSIIKTDGRPNYSPTLAQYNALGYHEMEGNAAQSVDGKVATVSGYEVVDGKWRTLYAYVDAPPDPPKVWRKVVIWQRLAALNAWQAFRELLDSQGLTDAWNATNELQEDFVIANNMTVAGLLQTVRTSLPITDAQWTEILDAAEVK